MCASVCPSGALTYGTREEVLAQRQRSAPMNRFQFGHQSISTKVTMLVPRDQPVEYVDVLSAMGDHTSGQDLMWMMYEPE